jgi:glycosyltransferase involved in cell wall biosynthesis
VNISVVICTFSDQRWQDLVAAVESVRRQTHPAHEIIVVVDHNAALVERVGDELADCRVVENDLAPGAAGSKQSGAAAATGEIVAFLDDDAEAEPGWLAAIGVPYADPRTIGVGGSIRPRWMVARPSWFPEEFNWVIGSTYRGMPTRRARVRNFIGANMSFRREVFDRVSLASRLGHVGDRALGGSDPDICIRVSRAFPDRVLVYEPAAIVHHRAHARRGTWSYFTTRCVSEGRSKALLTRMVGRGIGLSSERRYATSTLPAGVGRGILEAFRGDLSGLSRAAAIMAGLACTTTGYVLESVRPTDRES